MKYENEPINEELEAECWHEGIVTNYKNLTREQALILLGERMIENLLMFWRRELFPNCLLQNMAASDEETKKMLGSDRPTKDDKGIAECHIQHDSIQSGLINCKGVNGKMDADTKKRLNSYLELYDEISKKIEHESVIVTLLTEISKDRRAEQMKNERETKNNNDVVTYRQKRCMERLGIDCPENITRKEASVLIQEEIGKLNGAGD
jgi:hypothetical protein